MIKIEQLDRFHAATKLAYHDLANLFDRYDVWRFVDDAYDGLHVQGGMATYEDISTYLQNSGADLPL